MFFDREGIKPVIRCGEVFHAHPDSSWARGSNENGNRM
jgi:IS30 family transposase